MKYNRTNLKKHVRIHFGLTQKLFILVAVPCVVLTLVLSLYSSNLATGLVMDQIEQKLSISTSGIRAIPNIYNFSNYGIEVFWYDQNEIKYATREDAVGEAVPADVTENVFNQGHIYFSENMEVAGVKYCAYFTPFDSKKKTVGELNGSADTVLFAGMLRTDVDKSIFDVQLKLLIISIAICLVIISIGVIISRRIAKRLATSKEAVEKLALGELGHDFKSNLLEVGDETGEIYRGIRDLAGSTSAIVKNIRNVAGSLAKTSSVLKNTSDDAYYSTVDINEAISEISRAVSQQSDDAQKVNIMSERMGEVIIEVLREIKQLTKVSRGMEVSKNVTVESIEKLSKLNTSSVNIVRETYSQLEKTEKSMNEIRQVTEVITNISSNTNLLSLNASIEAARAGESGKGFAVVAGEIGHLASQSQMSAQEIEGIISNLIKDYAGMKEILQKLIEIIKNQSEAFETTSSTVEELSCGIADTLGGINQIGNKSNELEELRKNSIEEICSLSAIAEENAAVTQNAHNNVSTLSKVIEDIRNKSYDVVECEGELTSSIDAFKE